MQAVAEPGKAGVPGRTGQGAAERQRRARRKSAHGRCSNRYREMQWGSHPGFL